MTQWKPKQLEWKGGDPSWSASLGPFQFKISLKADGKYHANCNGYYFYSYDTIDEAKAACQEALTACLQAMIEPQPFWKPIEQCPKVEFKEYFLYRDGYGPWVGFYKDSKLIAVDTAENLDIRGITHYAEIPPLEAGK